MVESQSQMLARLIHSGGKILVVGGGVDELPKPYREHPGIVLWDDNRQDFQHKEVPTNTRAIIWNRWISHNTRNRLNDVAQRLHIVKFPRCRTAEIKALLSDIVQDERDLATVPAVQIPTDQELKMIAGPQDDDEPVQEAAVVKRAKSGRGKVQAFVAKHVSLTDYSAKGSIAAEARRLLKIAEREGLHTTFESLTNTVGRVVKQMRMAPDLTRKTTKPEVTAAPKTSVGDDFTELERLITDAITALKLVHEHLPKVLQETQELRAWKNQLKAFIKE